MAEYIQFCAVETIGDWVIRVDQRHGPAEHQQRHIHIAKQGLKGVYSWNLDGTRHDKHNFPRTEKFIKRAKAFAAERLHVPIERLQFITAISGGVTIRVCLAGNQVHQGFALFHSYIRIKQYVALFGAENGLVLVVCDVEKPHAAATLEDA